MEETIILFQKTTRFAAVIKIFEEYRFYASFGIPIFYRRTFRASITIDAVP